MIVDALILAGGRSSRLGGTAKSRLAVNGVTLLDRTIQAAVIMGVRRTVLIGDEVRDDLVTLREDPPFAGPVASIASGLRALSGDADAVLVLACDMPMIVDALPAVFSGFIGDGVIAIDRGRSQPLVILVRTSALDAAVHALPTIVDASMRSLLASLDLTEIVVPDGSTDDVDTWDDAQRLGAVR
ncbi:MAG: molybdenum cofactor guanylyltransferase [Pseudolysinimonas sp.]|uniref:molybdenum cofactor guanylyltransferase n=1 Tax=Pseudolysinimonas sp. TaxID=2680009 RepID=UPI003266154C